MNIDKKSLGINLSDIGMESGLKMYSDSKKKIKKKKNTFQVQGLVNDACVARDFPSEAYGQEVREDQEVHSVLRGKSGPKTLNVNDHYVQIECQGSLRIGQKITRSYLYISIMTDIDVRYSIKLSGTPTTAIWETRNSCKDNQILLDVINDLESRNLHKLMIGRLRYKPKKNYSSLFHKRNIKAALASLYVENDELVCELFLLGMKYKILMNKELTEKQKESYDFSGLWKMQLEDL